MMDYSNNLSDITKNVVDVNPMVLIEMGMIIQNDEQEASYAQQQEEENSMHIQMQHKIRQQMLLMHLDKLRAKDKKRKLAQPQQLANSDVEPNTDGLISLDDDGTSLQYHSSDDPGAGPLEKLDYLRHKYPNNPNMFKWLNPLLRSLEQAHQYVKNNGRKTEQWGKCFPSASHSFESRCSDLRQDLLRLELNIERFQNIFTKQLDVAEQNFKSFIADFHLESFVQETEEEEDDDFRECRVQSPLHHDANSDDQSDQSFRLAKERSSGRICGTSKDFSAQNDDASDMEGEPAIVDCRDMEPVPEIRDVNSDSPIPVDEITGDISYVNSEEDDDSNYIFVRSTSSRISPSQLISVTKPTITIKPVKFSSTPSSSKTNFDSSSKGETNTVKGTQNKRNSLRYSTKRANQASSDHPPQAKLKTSHHQKRKG